MTKETTSRSISILTLVFMLACNGAAVPVDGSAARDEGASEVAAASEDGGAPSARAGGDGARRVALVVAIADYASDTGWDDLACDRDLELLQPALEAQGFDVKTVTDAEATRAGIERAFREQLMAAVGPGDLAYFHYSGHGHQITDNNSDEIDGYDEVLVPHDAPAKPPAGYDGARHLRDDVLNSLLRELRRKVGEKGEVVVSLDSCFSGTGTRGEARARGRSTPIGPPQERTAEASEETGGGYLEGGPTARGGAVGDEGLAPMVAFSAARHDQLAIEASDDEGYPVGSLSYALVSALPDLGPRETYRSLFEKLRNEMAGYGVSNIPQAEGELDAGLFQGEPVVQDPFFKVGKLSSDGTQLMLEAGSVMGLFAGTRVAIYPAGTTAWRDAEPITSGDIQSVTPLQARVSINPAVYEEDVANAWAYVTAQSFGPVGIVARLEGEAAALEAALTAAIEKDGTKLVTFEGTPHVAIRKLDEGLVVEAIVDGRRLWGPPRSSGDPAPQLVQHLKDFARNRYLRRMELQSDALAVDLRVKPCAMDCDAFGTCKCEPPGSGRMEGGSLIMPEGVGYRLEIENTGKEEAYVQVLELMPDGQWDVLWPPRNQTALPVPPGETYTPDSMWQIGPPYGDNVLKVFASKQPIDFQWLLGPRVTSRGAPPNPLEALFAEALTPTSRGSTAKAVGTDGGVTTSAVTFQITE